MLRAAPRMWRRSGDGTAFKKTGVAVGPPAIGTLSHPFLSWLPTTIDYRKKVGTLILTSPLEDLVAVEDRALDLWVFPSMDAPKG